MRLRSARAIVVCFLALTGSAPCWAQFDAIFSGAKAVQDEAYQKIMANQMIQLVLEAKKNYDASMKIYAQVKQLNEGRGLVANVASDLGARARSMGQDDLAAFQSAAAYNNDSLIDRKIEQANDAIRNGIADRGIAVVDQYAGSVNKQSAEYAKMLKKWGERLTTRGKRVLASREQGVKLATLARDLGAKGEGLELQMTSDQVEALNEIIALDLIHDVKDKAQEINGDREIADALKFLQDRQGMAKSLEESFYMVRLSRAPALLSSTRQSVSTLAGMLLAVLLGAGMIYEFSQTKTLIPEVLGLPLVLVVFGLLFYDKVFVAFSVMLDAMEQTIVPGKSIASSVYQTSSGMGLSGLTLFSSFWVLKGLSIAMAYLTWGILIVFLWVRFAFFCLIYAVGPLMIVCALFEPLRSMTKGWMTSAVQVGLWGIFMRILVHVVMSSGASAMTDPSGGVLKPVFSAFVVNLVFLLFSVICPYFTNLLISGNIAEKAVGTVSAGQSSIQKAQRAYGRLRESYDGWKEKKKEEK